MLFLIDDEYSTDNHRFEPRSIDNTSVTSGTSTVTMETIHSIEHKISSLTNHLNNNDKKFDEMMQLLRQTISGGQAPPSTTTNSTSNGGQSEAGDNTFVSGNVL